jgi:hypothetical protein
MIFVEQTESRRVRRQSCNSDQVRKEKGEHEEQILCRMSPIDCATAQGVACRTLTSCAHPRQTAEVSQRSALEIGSRDRAPAFVLTLSLPKSRSALIFGTLRPGSGRTEAEFPRD